MKAALVSVIDELKALRKEGVSHVYVSDDAIRGLKERVSAGSSNDDVSATRVEKEEDARAAIPDSIRSATAEDFDRILKERESSKPEDANPSGRKLPRPPVVELPDGDKKARWEALRSMVLGCPVCMEHVRPSCRIVFGVGNIDADIFFCGEAPGADEEEQGEPFVGKAGQLLNKMIQGMGLQRDKVYIGNIMNWRPELPSRVGNRPPTSEEMSFCLPYLKAQVEVVNPKVIVTLGATAAKGLLGEGSFRSLREIKGQWQDFDGTPVLPTYHPSYLLRNDTKRDKRAAWEDLLKVMERVALPISDKQRSYFL